MRRRNNLVYGAGCLVMCAALGVSCVDKYLPESLDSFDKDATFSTTIYEPVLGRTNVLTANFNPGNSTLPLTFTLVDVKRNDGAEAPELTQNFPVQVWKTPYLGTEKSLEEINAKRGTEYRPLFQVRQYSGEIVLWANANSSFVKCYPDSGYVFSVRAENSGGWKEYANLKLIPKREADYEPNYTDEATGISTQDYVTPTGISNVYKEGYTGTFGEMTAEDVHIFFRENTDNPESGHTLTFRFMTEDFKPINPAKFSGTDWANLVHGFDMEMTDEYVRYKVAYPIPLAEVRTRYTNATGDKAHVEFSYDRLMWETKRVTARMSFEFAIYRPAHWEIIFVFSGGNPNFENS